MPRLLLLSDDHDFADLRIARARPDASPAEFADHPPAVVVFHQPLPSDVPRATVELWRATFPFARLIVVLGPWCEGEMRTGFPLPGVERIRWSDWRIWLDRTLPSLDDAPAPPTASLAERIEWATTGSFRAPIVAWVSAVRPDDFGTLVAVVESLGGTAAIENPDNMATVDWILWDGDPCDANDRKRLEDASARWPRARRAAFINFPRPNEHQEVAVLKGALIFAKPFLLADLATALAQRG